MARKRKIQPRQEVLRDFGLKNSKANVERITKLVNMLKNNLAEYLRELVNHQVDVINRLSKDNKTLNQIIARTDRARKREQTKLKQTEARLEKRVVKLRQKNEDKQTRFSYEFDEYIYVDYDAFDNIIKDDERTILNTRIKLFDGNKKQTDKLAQNWIEERKQTHPSIARIEIKKVTAVRENVLPTKKITIIQSKMKDACPVQRTVLGCQLNLPIDESMVGKCCEQFLINYFSKYHGIKVDERRIIKWVNEFRQNPIEYNDDGLPLQKGTFIKSSQPSAEPLGQLARPLDGIAPVEMAHIANKLGVSHYCISVDGTFLMRNVVKKAHSKAIMYVTDGTHCYPIVKPETILSLCQKDENAGLLKRETRTIHSFSKYDRIADVPPEATGDIFIVKDHNLKDYFENICETKNIIYDKTKYMHKGVNMVQFFERDDRRLYVCPDIDILVETCKKLNIPLTSDNLSIAKIAVEFYKTVNDVSELEMSELNEETLEKLMCSENRGGVAENIFPLRDEMNHYGYDINKCYTAVLLDENIPKPVCKISDEFRPYQSGEAIVSHALYIVETSNQFPLRGFGVYCGWELIRCRELNIKYSITEVLIPSDKLEQEHITKFVKKAYELGKDIGKALTNPLTGMMSVWNKTFFSAHYAKSIEEASYYLLNTDSDIVPTGDKTRMYAVQKSKDVLIFKNGLPTYTAIINAGRWRLWDLCLKCGMTVNQRGLPARVGQAGYIMRLATDSVFFSLPVEEKHESLETSDEIGGCKPLAIDFIRKKMGKAKQRDIGKKTGKTFDFFLKDTQTCIPKFGAWEMLDVDEKNWKENDWAETNAKLLTEGEQSFHISGIAGTGKTYFARKVVEALREQGKKVYVGAFTNMACNNLGGKTLHRLFRIRDEDERPQTGHFHKGDVLVVDECSMIGDKFYSAFQQLKQKGVRFIVVGDFHQLEPVGDKPVSPDSYIFRYITDNRKVELTICKRYDAELYTQAKGIIEGKNWEFLVDGSEAELEENHICATNKTRRRINDILMRKFAVGKETIEYEIDITAKTQPLCLARGSPLVCFKEMKRISAINSSSWTVESFDEENICIANEIGAVSLSHNEFVKHFTSGYALTVHRAQGRTLEGKLRIWDSRAVEEMGWSYKWLYTATTRATKYENVYLAMN